MRPLCKCKRRPAAINYKKGNKTYYRKLCERCLRNGTNYGIPKWQQRGYEKKNFCEKCNYHLSIKNSLMFFILMEI